MWSSGTRYEPAILIAYHRNAVGIHQDVAATRVFDKTFSYGEKQMACTDCQTGKDRAIPVPCSFNVSSARNERPVPGEYLNVYFFIFVLRRYFCEQAVEQSTIGHHLQEVGEFGVRRFHPGAGLN